MPARSKFLPYAAAVVAAIIWGFSFLFTKNTLASLGTFQLLGFRFLLGAALLTALAAARVIHLRLTPAKLKGLLLVALLQPVLYFVGETLGVKLTSASEAGIVIALAPIAITLCSVLLLKERLSALKWASVFVCVAGVIAIALAKGFEAGGQRLAGLAALMGAVIAAGFYNPLSRIASRESTPLEITFTMMWVGAIVFNAIGLAMTPGGVGGYFAPFANPHVMLNIAYLGILSSCLAFFLLNYALSKLESTTIGALLNLTPVISVFAGVALGGERLAPMQLVGAAMILAGIWGIARGKASAKASANAPLPVQPE